MSKLPRSSNVSRDQWLHAAMDLFSRVGEQGLTIHRLAREVGVSKAGFYWHFRDRDDLLRRMLDYWSHEFTEVLSENHQLLELPPAERLLQIMRLNEDHNLSVYDVHFRAWAQNDPEASEKIAAVFEKRLNMVRNAYAELGFKGDELEMRARLFICYGSNERSMFDEFGGKSRGQRQRLWKSFLKLAATAP